MMVRARGEKHRHKDTKHLSCRPFTPSHLRFAELRFLRTLTKIHGHGNCKRFKPEGRKLCRCGFSIVFCRRRSSVVIGRVQTIESVWCLLARWNSKFENVNGTDTDASQSVISRPERPQNRTRMNATTSTSERNPQRETPRRFWRCSGLFL